MDALKMVTYEEALARFKHSLEIKRNAEKYPVEKAFGSAKKYNEL